MFAAVVHQSDVKPCKLSGPRLTAPRVFTLIARLKEPSADGFGDTLVGIAAARVRAL